jgi:nucleotide-binding universal stress UspA family protein
MARILVPVDFSVYSFQAALYAGKLAEQAGYPGEIILLTVSSAGAAGSDGTPVSGMDEVVHEAVNKALQSWQMKVFAATKVPVSFRVSDNSLAKAVVEASEEDHCDLVLMVLESDTLLDEKVWGSTALDIIARSHVPVLVVPKGYEFRPVQKLAFAVDFIHASQDVPMEPTKKLLSWLQPKLHMVHVHTGEDKKHPEQVIEGEHYLMNEFASMYPSMTTLYVPDFVEAVKQFCQSEQIDMVGLFPHKHSWVERLFNTPYTAKLVFHAGLPVLAIPH